MAKRKGKDPLESRMQVLDKSFKRTGSIYSNKPKSEKKKKKGHKLTPEGKYNVTLMNFQFHLYELICEINNIDLDYYLMIDPSRGHAQLVNDFRIDDTFKRLSSLKWDEPSTIDSLYFRGRFCTCLLYKIVRNTHAVIKHIYAETSNGHMNKYKLRHVILEKWIQIIDSFVVSYLSAKQDYLSSLYKIYELIGCIENRTDDVIDHIADTEQLIRRGNEPDGVVVNNVTKLAFILATNSFKLGKCPAYDEELRYDDFNSTLSQVGGLGYAIMRRRSKDGSKPPIMYLAFQKSNPLIVSRFYKINEEAPEITVGLKALEFSKMFYGNDIRYHNIIDQLM